MKICFVGSRKSVPPPAIETAQALAGAGHEVHLLLASGAGDPAEHGDSGSFWGLIVHRQTSPSRWLGMFGPRRARRAWLNRAIRAIDPGVVHWLDDEGRRLDLPAGLVVLRSGPVGPIPVGADAVVTPDGRFLDRTGSVLDCPDVPPESSASPVADGLDPDDSATQWRVLTYLAGVDQLRRQRRVRLDRGHGGSPPPRRRHFRAATPRGSSRAVS